MIQRAVVLGLAAAIALGQPARAADHPAPSAPTRPSPSPATAAPSAPAPAPSPFAVELAQRPLAAADTAWSATTETAAWAALAEATPVTRQAVRWRYVQGLIARAKGSEALGVLDVMATTDPALPRIPAWRRAQGVALALLARTDAAIAAFDDPALATDPETCLWRMRVLATAERAVPALQALGCAMPALNARSGRARRPFILAAAHAAIQAGRPSPALLWLDHVPATDPAAALLRGEAELAQFRAGPADRQPGRPAPGSRWFDAVASASDPELRAAAVLARIEAGLAAKTLSPAAALRQLDELRFRWRGGAVERRALILAMTLATDRHDEPALLAAGAALLRYGATGADTVRLSTTLQAHLLALIAPESRLPLGTAAGLLWEYRDLMPTGADGDRIVWMLADRLQQAGLYRRAAELLGRRLDSAERDVEQGPLSVRIATLRILAGAPDAAIRVLRDTSAIAYPASIQDDRRRVQATALELLGQHAEALATLADMSDARPLRAELAWFARDWPGLVAIGAPMLPPASPGARLSAEAQAIILRQAIACAMLGREDVLAQLNRRYARAFAALPTAPVFAMLTAPVGTVDPARLERAMAALPAAGPAGAIGDLLTAGQAARGSAALN